MTIEDVITSVLNGNKARGIVAYDKSYPLVMKNYT